MVSIGIKVSSCSGRLAPRRLFFNNFTPYYPSMNSIIPYSRSRITNIQDRSTDFTLTIFEEDYIRIQNLVSKIPNAETGGNLFGLWTNQGNAVVRVATGPGKNCKRSCALFKQDIPYMQQVGNLVTREYGLCHIGEWHSHHQMQLYEPSYGDCNYVQRNYPTGSQGFILVIANILQNSAVKLSPFKFTDERSSFKRGEIEVLRAENPFMKVTQITSAIKNGKEERISLQESSGIVTNEYTCLPDEEQNYKDKHLKQNYPSSSPPNTRSLLPNKMIDRSSQHETQIGHRMKKAADQVDVKRSAKNPQPSSPPKNPSEGSLQTTSGILGVSSSQITLPFGAEKLTETTPCINSTANSQDRSQVQTDKDMSRYNRTTQWYEIKPETLRKTLDFVRSLADDQNTVIISRHKSTLDTTMTFTHHNYKWSIDFPHDFPVGSVKLKKFRSFGLDTYHVEGRGNIDRFKAELKSLLQGQCARCKNYNTRYNHSNRYY